MKQDALRDLVSRAGVARPANFAPIEGLVSGQLKTIEHLLGSVRSEETPTGNRWPPVWIPVARESIEELNAEYPDDSVDGLQEHIELELPHEEMWVGVYYARDNERFLTALYPYQATWYIDTTSATVYCASDTLGAEAMQELLDWVAETTKHELKALLASPERYRRRIEEALPLRDRFGKVLRRHIWEVVPGDHYLKDELTETEKRTFEDMAPELEDGGTVASLTAAGFLEYCKICYVGAGMANDTDEPRVLYRSYADGRDDGLLELPDDDPDAFAGWYRHFHIGHPWEIAAGGNTTHISLTPALTEDGYRLILAGTSASRAAETIQMAIALHRASVPVSLIDLDIHKRRIRGSDLVGIVPDSYSGRYHNRKEFPEKDMVYDCYPYFTTLADNPALEPYIEWLPLKLPETMEEGRQA